MKIYFVRHGQTDNNLNQLTMGRIDGELNKNGILQAKQTAQNLKNIQFDVIFSSPLKRAYQTAQIINTFQNVQLITDNRLMERDLGDMSGVPYSLLDETADWNWTIGSQTTKNLHAETMDEVKERVKDFFNYLKVNFSSKKVLVVSHDGVARGIYALLNNSPKGTNMLFYRVPNGEVVIYEI